MANALDLVGLSALMRLSAGRSEVAIGLIDGPIWSAHADLAGSAIRKLSGKAGGDCATADSLACLHGTFMAGILVAKRGSPAPAICPDCTLLAYPIFADAPDNKEMPSATPQDLAAAVLTCIEAGAQNPPQFEPRPHAILRQSGTGAGERHWISARKRAVIVVAAAGNQGSVGGTIITRHPWVIPVAACDALGRPTRESNLGHSMGLRGLSAPGERIASLGADGKPITLGGTSVAAPFVTGTVALLWSEFPAATAADVRSAVTQAIAGRRTTVTPPSSSMPGRPTRS